MEDDVYAMRRAAIHLLRSGQTPAEVAAVLKRSESWVYKWRKRFQEEGWAGLKDRSRAPHNSPRRLPDEIRQMIRQTRSGLEAEMQEPHPLTYIGAPAIRARLKATNCHPLPSISSIERELRAAGMTRPRAVKSAPVTIYPHLQPGQPHELIQVDIYPHYLPGGTLVNCFNALDVASRFPAGMQLTTKRSQDAMAFLLFVWQEIGIPTYTQVDNEACFSGGFTHPYVLGRVLRLALLVGTELVFSPFYHPKSNCFVERFHLDYQHQVWERHHLEDLPAARQQSKLFFEAYRLSEHHAALKGRSPAVCHSVQSVLHLPKDFCPPQRPPLTEGRVHFMRQVDAHRQISLLNVAWDIPTARPDQGVWATLEFRQQAVTLRIYDAAPDASKRRCLAEHPFPLNEPVLPLADEFRRQEPSPPLPRLTKLLRAALVTFYDVLKVGSVVKVRRFSTMS